MQTVFRPTRLVFAGVGIAMVLNGSVAPAARATEPQVGSIASPAPVVPASPVVPALDAVEFERAPDGLFYVTGLVNGQSIRFLVDTGASVVMLTREDAATVGLKLDRAEFQSHVRTANGASAMAWTRLQNIDIAGHQLSQIDAAVPQDGLPVSLLGQNLLRKLGVVTIDGDRLRVHNRAAKAS